MWCVDSATKYNELSGTHKTHKPAIPTKLAFCEVHRAASAEGLGFLSLEWRAFQPRNRRKRRQHYQSQHYRCPAL
jgi:hypothetical protein